MATNLESLSTTELQALIKNAEAQMESARKNHGNEVRTKIGTILANSGRVQHRFYEPLQKGHGLPPVHQAFRTHDHLTTIYNNAERLDLKATGLGRRLHSQEA